MLIFMQHYTLLLLCCNLFMMIKSSNSKCLEFKQKLINSSEIITRKSHTATQNVILKPFMKKFGKRLIYGRIAYINNPQSTINILQPKNDNQGCSKNETYETSYTSAEANNCEIATNAGFFNVHTKACIGNIINNGKIYLNSGGIKNANFGIKKDGSLFFGYLSAEEVNSGDFDVLVSGVIWLLRNKQMVVNQSILDECSESQDTGSLYYFATVISARTAVGATEDGRLVIVHIDGRTNEGGINLIQLASLLREMGVVSAINLDGGGSSTLVVNQTLISYPSDWCGIFTCERPISTVLCVRAKCPAQCPPSSQCIQGFCRPIPFWNLSTLSMVLLGFLGGFLFYIIFVKFIPKLPAFYRHCFQKKTRPVANKFDDLALSFTEPLMNDIESDVDS